MISILDTLGLFLDDQRAPLTLAFDDQGALSGFFGNPLMYGIDANELLGKQADEVLPVLYGLDLRERKHLNMVALRNGVPADIHVIPHRAGVNVVLVDMSDERSRRQKVQQRLHDLELAAERARSSENAGDATEVLTLAHEIRNPLFSISGYCDWILHSMNEDPSVAEKVTVINTNARYLLGLVDRLLNREGPDEPLCLVPTDVRRLGDEIRNLFSPQVVEKQIGFNLHFELPDRPLVLDADKLKQVLINVVGNAIKYTDSGFVSITFRYADQTLAILVEDSGLGIPSDEQGLVTQPFFRSDRTRHLPGIGIGLSVTRALLDLMQGAMQIRSVEHWGTTVALQIPSDVQSEVTADPSVAVAQEDDLERQARDQGRSLLLVDDDPDILAILEFYLTSAGHRVAKVTPDSLDGIVAACRSVRPEVVIVDLQIHRNFDGFTVIDRLLAEQINTAIILLTAENDRALRQRIDQSGCDLLLRKPISRDELLEAIASVTKR